MDTNTVEVIQSFGTKLDSYLQALASKAGVATEHFWPILVRQQMIEGLVPLVIGAIALSVLLYCIKVFRSHIGLANESVSIPHYADTPKQQAEQAAAYEKLRKANASRFITVVSGFFGAICVFILLSTLWDSKVIAGKILNQEYHAVQ
jgi:hypothetical protein